MEAALIPMYEKGPKLLDKITTNLITSLKTKCKYLSFPPAVTE